MSLPSCVRPAGTLWEGAAPARGGGQEPLSGLVREVCGCFWSWQWPDWCAATPWGLRLHPGAMRGLGWQPGAVGAVWVAVAHPGTPPACLIPGARDGTRGLWGACSHSPAGRYHTPSLQQTGTKQVAKKWCHCVMSNLCIIKILFEQMSQEASGLVSQAGAAKFFWPSVAELGVSVLLAPAGITVVVREPCLPVGT